MTSVETIDMLDRLYMEFDEILHKQGMHCVDIIGDAYMAVSGLMGEPHLTQVAAPRPLPLRRSLPSPPRVHPPPPCPSPPPGGEPSLGP